MKWRLSPRRADEHPSYALGVLGMPGLQPIWATGDWSASSGGTVVVAAATAPVGSVVGQIAKLKDAMWWVSLEARENADLR